MANQPFNRTIINPLEKPLSSDINQGWSQTDRTIREVLMRLLSSRLDETAGGYTENPVSGFLGNAARLVPNAAFNVTLKAGVGFQYDNASTPAAIGGVIGLDDLHPYKPIVIASDVAITVPAAPGANSRIDIIEVKYLRQSDNAQSRQVLDPIAGTFSPSNLAKTLDFDVEASVGYVVDPANSTTAIGYKQGTVAAGPVAPATTAGYVKVAEIVVAAGDVTVGLGSIVDRRKILHPGNMLPFAGAWNIVHGTPSVVTLRHLMAPPGVFLGLIPEDPQHGAGDVYVFAGEAARIFCQITVGRGNAADWAAGEFVVCDQNKPVTDPTTLIAGELTNLALTVPLIQAGIGSKYGKFLFSTRYQASGVTNATNAALDDINVYAHGWVSY